MNNLNGLEYAEEVYSKICDIFEVLEENRFDDELEPEDVERVEKLEYQIRQLEQSKLRSEDSEYFDKQIQLKQDAINSIKLKSDYVKNTLIQAIRKNRLKVDEDDNVVYELKNPISYNLPSDVGVKEVIFNPDFTQADFDRQMVGVKVDDQMGTMNAQLACFCNITRTDIGLLHNKDVRILRQVNSLFTRAEL